MAKLRLTLFLFIVFSISGCWRQMWGDNPLGDNFSLLDGDKTEDRAIVYCTGYDAGACKGGLYIVPSYSRHYDAKGNYAEYVETAKSNDDFIIAKTHQIPGSKTNYWVINKEFSISNCDSSSCDSTIQSHVFGPFDQNSFAKKISDLKVDLTFDDN